MKIKDLDSGTFDQLVDLECENIIPILASVGINLNRDQMIFELESFKEDNIVLYKGTDFVDGFIVYKINADHILIKTFNLRSSNNKKILLGLLLAISKELYGSEVELLISHCHLTNQKSLNLHRGLGFIESSKNDKFIEFHAKKNDILDMIKSKTERVIR